MHCSMMINAKPHRGGVGLKDSTCSKIQVEKDPVEKVIDIPTFFTPEL